MKNEKQQIYGIYLLVGILIGLMTGMGIHSNQWNDGFISVIVLSSTTALGEFFLQFCFQPGNIFGWYRDWLDKYFYDNPKNPFSFMYKPLGACAYCQNTWLGIAAWTMGHIYFGMSWWLLLPVLFLSHLFLTVLDYTFWQ